MDFSEKFSIIQKELKLSQKEFAAKIELSPNAISQYLTGKRKPDINTVQKLIDLGVSPLFLFADVQTPFDATYNKFVEARLKYGDEELTQIIKNYLLSKNILTTIKEKIERLKGQTFFEKLSNIISGDGERFLILFYAILLDIEKNQLSITSDNLNKRFSEIVKNHDFSYFEAFKFGIILKKKDFEELTNWIESELDNVSIIEILSCIPDLKKLLKNELNLLDKTVVTVIEKLFL